MLINNEGRTIFLTMEDWVSNSMSNWVSNKSMVAKNSMVGNWVSNNSMVGKWVSNNSMVGNWGMSNNSRSILRDSFIGDILDDSISIVSVLDSLDPAIRKSDSVAAGCGVSISLLLLLEVVAAVVITHSVVESIESRLS